ncbi:piggyBac transposable element-derived protein 4-like [Osmerus mordax]|uniref:piggyBac transposable element-derived protein 4-like n=1 Tax=Osmerus mordax TaxID=8014 RepID=UPI00350FEB83
MGIEDFAAMTEYMEAFECNTTRSCYLELSDSESYSDEDRSEEDCEDEGGNSHSPQDDQPSVSMSVQGPEVTVDEQLLAFRGRCPFKQYMPSKPAKYGIKSWVACDAKSSYAWKMQVYTGKQMDGVPERNQGMRVVLDVTEGLKDRNLPSELLTTKTRRVLSSQFAFTPTTTLVSYLAKKNKNVLLMSTRHTDAEISDRNDGKPTIVLDYNLNKGGVDNLDKVITAYSCKRKTPAGPSSSSATSLTSPPTTPL